MHERPFWTRRVHDLLRQRSVLWLQGVRRVGKTVLCRSLEGTAYFDCELPRARRALEDPELFFRDHREGLVVLDEIHRLTNSSEVLKIAADHFPDIRVVATGSSTLAARQKFRDTLTGRKLSLWLLPSTLADLRAFGVSSPDLRMLRGGLPPFLLDQGLDDEGYRGQKRTGTLTRSRILLGLDLAHLAACLDEPTRALRRFRAGLAR